MLAKIDTSTRNRLDTATRNRLDTATLSPFNAAAHVQLIGRSSRLGGSCVVM